MRYPFDTTASAIILEVELVGPSCTRKALLVLDTGASQTVIAPSLLVLLGYGPSPNVQPVQIVSASGVANAALLQVSALRALGHEAKDFPVVAHSLPAATGVNGVLGLDFFRDKELLIDFRAGFISLT